MAAIALSAMKLFVVFAPRISKPPAPLVVPSFSTNAIYSLTPAVPITCNFLGADTGVLGPTFNNLFVLSQSRLLSDVKVLLSLQNAGLVAVPVPSTNPLMSCCVASLVLSADNVNVLAGDSDASNPYPALTTVLSITEPPPPEGSVTILAACPSFDNDIRSLFVSYTSNVSMVCNSFVIEGSSNVKS